MAYKDSKGGKFMNNGKGMNSYSKNPMKMASQVEPMCGPGLNADQRKANKLLKAAYKEEDSMRGESGM